jgi:hypothetical protein
MYTSKHKAGRRDEVDEEKDDEHCRNSYVFRKCFPVFSVRKTLRALNSDLPRIVKRCHSSEMNGNEKKQTH